MQSSDSDTRQPSRSWTLLDLARLVPALVLFGATAVATVSHVPAVSATVPTPVTIDFTVSNRTYNATPAATITGCTVMNAANTAVIVDTVGCSYTLATAAFASANAGTWSVTGSGFTLTGGHAYRYTIQTIAPSSGTISQAPLTVTAVFNNKTADGDTSAATLPSVSGTIYGSDTPAFIEAYDTSAAGSGKTLTPSGIVNDGNVGANYAYTFNAISTGNIRPAPAAAMTFSAQPIDTQVSTPIYDACAPATSGTNPCALSTAANPSTPVKVLVVDAYGNRAGPGAPGDDGSVAAISVTIRNNTAAGALLGTASTSNGTAAFGDQLVIGTTGPTHLYASTTAGSAPHVTSSQILISSLLKACVGTVCVNQANGSSGAKAYGTIVGQVNFYGASTNVLFTTGFSSPSDTTGKCGVNSSSSSTGTIGDSIEQRISGYGIQTALPAETQVLVIPIKTLQAAGVSSRNASVFNVCLGAVNLNSRFAPSAPWKASNGHGGLVNAVGARDDPSDPTSLFRYWGVPAACGTPGLSTTDPCVTLKTKNANELSQALGGISVSSFFKNSDIAIVIRQPNPWDGKGGVYS